MTCWRMASIALAAVWTVAGCHRPRPEPALSPVTNSAPANPFMITNAQPKLPTMKLWLGAQELTAEIAMNPREVATGMMFRKEMDEKEGMLFVFRWPHRASFYMRNTLLPLSCAYIDSTGKILEIHDMKPLDESSIEADSDQVQYVLEVKQGWFQRNQVGIGAVLRSERGTLQETFFSSMRQ